jgi:hypothetical protein
VLEEPGQAKAAAQALGHQQRAPKAVDPTTNVERRGCPERLAMRAPLSWKPVDSSPEASGAQTRDELNAGRDDLVSVGRAVVVRLLNQAPKSADGLGLDDVPVFGTQHTGAQQPPRGKQVLEAGEALKVEAEHAQLNGGPGCRAGAAGLTLEGPAGLANGGVH